MSLSEMSFGVALSLVAVAFGAVPLSVRAAASLRRPVDAVLAPAFSAHYDHDTSHGSRNYYCDSRLVYDRHGGTDFRATVGTAVKAAARGTIYYAINTCPDTGYYGSSCGGGYGNHVRLDHEGAVDGLGTVTIYGHMKSASLAAFCGTVPCGFSLGLSGNSGNSTGPHLHFEVRQDGYPLDDPFSGQCGTRTVSLWSDQNGGVPTVKCSQ